ncbi:MAG: SH3 domain-containing protein [Anaerolineae bacterium]|nr:SH3 domain-containing protein [Anaerolineae bacterium]
MIRYIRLFMVLAFILSFAVSPVMAQDLDNHVVVDTGAINIRSGPAPNTTSLGSVPGGTELPVTGRNADTTWWRVDSPFGVGWVADYLVAFRGHLASVPIVNTPAGTLETPVVFVEGYPVKVYRNPNEDSFVVGIAPTGSTLVIAGRSMDGNWWQVETVMGLGWVNAGEVALRGDGGLADYIVDPGPSFDGPTVRVNAATSVTSAPGSGDVIGTLPAGAALPAGGRTVDNTWWQVSDIFGIGWIPVANVSLAGAASNIRVTSYVYTSGPGYTGAAFAKAIVESDRKVAYASDSFNSDPMWDAHLGEELGITARSVDGLWLEVTSSRGYNGWMNFSGLTLNGSMAGLPIRDTTPVYENIVIINTGSLHVRTGPGVEYESLGAFPGGTVLDVTGRHPTLPYIRVEGSYGVGWVRIMYIIFRGDWNAVPKVTEPVGNLELPRAVVNFPHNVYSQPDFAYPAGSIEGGVYTIVGWSPGFTWALIDTPLGKVWIHSDEFELRGIADNAPIIR